MAETNLKAPELNVAVCQLTSGDSVDQNIRDIESVLSSLEHPAGLDLVSFPENSLYFRINDGDPRVGMTLEDQVLQRLSRWSQAHQTTVHIGSVPLTDGTKATNATVLLTPDGNVTVPYKKIHLFDVDVEGHVRVRESDFFVPGSEPGFFEIKGWKFGATICYDVRFSELFLRYAKAGVDVILIPAAFIVPTGRAHWDILVRARAIECQAYVLAAAQGGLHKSPTGGTRETYGHSLIVDPWGQVLGECLDRGDSRVLRSSLKAEKIEAVRRQIPIQSHRRLT